MLVGTSGGCLLLSWQTRRKAVRPLEFQQVLGETSTQLSQCGPYRATRSIRRSTTTPHMILTPGGSHSLNIASYNPNPSVPDAHGGTASPSRPHAEAAAPCGELWRPSLLRAWRSQGPAATIPLATPLLPQPPRRPPSLSGQTFRPNFPASACRGERGGRAGSSPAGAGGLPSG